MKRLLLIFPTILLISFSAIAVTHFVPDDYSTIQEAINNSQASDTIWVANGVYMECINVPIPLTFIGENWENTVIHHIGTGNATVVIEDNSNVTFKEFTLRCHEDNHGRWVVRLLEADFIHFEHCQFKYGMAGIYLQRASDCTVSRCYIADNYFGMQLINSSLSGGSNQNNLIANNIFANNDSCGINFMHIDGGYHQSNNVIGNQFYGNSSGIYSIMFNENNIIGNNFVDNAYLSMDINQCIGGGEGNIFHHNNFLLGETGQDLVRNSGQNVWSNTITHEGNYWDDYEGLDEDNNGIGDDPYVVSVMGPVSNLDNFPLMNRLYASISGNVVNPEGEPLEGATVSVIGTELTATTDLNGNYLISGLDAGFYDLFFEHPNYLYSYGVAIPSTLDEETVYNTMIPDDASVPPENTAPIVEFRLEQNFPNPFNASTKISFELYENAHVTLEIFDINGRCVSTLVNTAMSSGIHTITWNGENSHGSPLGSGIYFYRIKSGTSSQCKKLIILK